MLVRPTIRRGSDSSFIIRLRDDSGNPYDLTGVTYVRVELPKENTGAVTVDSAATPAVKAYATITGVGPDTVTVKFTATTGGIAGNDISLDFDGSDSLDDVVAAWNGANPSNQVSHDADDGDLVPDSQSVQLSQGVDAYQKAYARTPLVLGTIVVQLAESDTSALKVGKNQAIKLTVDKGTPPAGIRKVVVIRDAVSVEEKFF